MTPGLNWKYTYGGYIIVRKWKGIWLNTILEIKKHDPNIIRNSIQ
jgi:hypothetical protein